MDNVLLVVDDLKAGIEDVAESGLALEGARSVAAVMLTPHRHGRRELDKSHTRVAVRREPVDAPVNALEICRILFTADDIDDILTRLRAYRNRQAPGPIDRLVRTRPLA
jgi:hypothetical protein